MIELLNAIAAGKVPSETGTAVLRAAARELLKLQAETSALQEAVSRVEQTLAYGLAGKPKHDRLPSIIAPLTATTAALKAGMPTRLDAVGQPVVANT